MTDENNKKSIDLKALDPRLRSTSTPSFLSKEEVSIDSSLTFRTTPQFLQNSENENNTKTTFLNENSGSNDVIYSKSDNNTLPLVAQAEEPNTTNNTTPTQIEVQESTSRHENEEVADSTYYQPIDNVNNEEKKISVKKGPGCFTRILIGFYTFGGCLLFTLSLGIVAFVFLITF